MRQHHGQRQVFRRFVRGVACHDALIARARLRARHRLRDVRGLCVDADGRVELAVVAEVGASVADSLQRVAHDPFLKKLRPGAHLPGDGDAAVGRHDLDRHAGVGVAPEVSVQDAVRDLVAELVGMAAADRFRRQGTGLFAHVVSLLSQS